MVFCQGFFYIQRFSHFSCWGEKTMMKIHQKIEETCKECEGMPAMLDIDLFENDDDDTEDLVMDLASASSSPFKFGQNYQTMVIYLCCKKILIYITFATLLLQMQEYYIPN